MDVNTFHTELQTRLVGGVALIQAVLPLLRQGAGRIVWIVTPATIPTPYVTSIHACDFAVNCIARTLAIELKPWQIPVIQVRCGGIKTAKGLETTAEVDAIFQHPQAELYRQPLRQWSKDMADFDLKRTEPEQVARVVQKALNCAQTQAPVFHRIYVRGSGLPRRPAPAVGGCHSEGPVLTIYNRDSCSSQNPCLRKILCCSPNPRK